MFNRLFFSVPTGYFATFNATHYEFDISMYCPIGTVVFEAMHFYENPDDIQLALVDFSSGTTGTIRDFEPFSLNGMGNGAVVGPDGLITLTTDQLLNANDVTYDFSLSSLVTTGAITESITAIVIVHKKGKQLWKSFPAFLYC